MLRDHITEQKVEWRNVAVMRDKEQFKCTECGLETATGLCTECNLKLCEFCTSYHKRSLRTKDHGVVSIEAVSNEELFNKQTVQCSVHAEKKVKYFCQNCKEAICSNCVVDTHKGHTFSPLDDVAKEQIDSVKKSLDVYGTVEQNYREYLRKIEQFHEQCVNECESSEKLINETFAELSSILEEEKAKLLTWVRDKSKNSTEIINEVRQKVDHVGRMKDYLKEVQRYPFNEVVDILPPASNQFDADVQSMKTVSERRSDIVVPNNLTFTTVLRDEVAKDDQGNKNAFEVKLLARKLQTNPNIEGVKRYVRHIRSSFTLKECRFPSLGLPRAVLGPLPRNNATNLGSHPPPTYLGGLYNGVVISNIQSR